MKTHFNFYRFLGVLVLVITPLVTLANIISSTSGDSIASSGNIKPASYRASPSSLTSFGDEAARVSPTTVNYTVREKPIKQNYHHHSLLRATSSPPQGSDIAEHYDENNPSAFIGQNIRDGWIGNSVNSSSDGQNPNAADLKFYKAVHEGSKVTVFYADSNASNSGSGSVTLVHDNVTATSGAGWQGDNCQPRAQGVDDCMIKYEIESQG